MNTIINKYINTLQINTIINKHLNTLQINTIIHKYINTLKINTKYMRARINTYKYMKELI